jgi:hypothetical protein
VGSGEENVRPGSLCIAGPVPARKVKVVRHGGRRVRSGPAEP